MNAKDARTGILDTLLETKVITDEMHKACLADETADIDLAELHIDSLSIFDFCLMAEDRVGMALEPEDIVENAKLSSLAAFIAARAND